MKFEFNAVSTATVTRPITVEVPDGTRRADAYALAVKKLKENPDMLNVTGEWKALGLLDTPGVEDSPKVVSPTVPDTTLFDSLQREAAGMAPLKGPFDP